MVDSDQEAETELFAGEAFFFFVFRVKSRTWWQPPILIVSFFLFRRQLKKEQVYFDGKQREGKKGKNTVLVWFRDLQEVILFYQIVKKE